MKINHLVLLAGLFLCLPFATAIAQDKVPIKFGKLAPEDFDLSKAKFDSGASAVVIADVGNSYFEGNSKGWFSLVFERKKRIKILNKNGFDAATEEIDLYSEGTNEEKLLNLKAVTYNLENGTVVQTKLDEASIYKEKLSKNVVRKKFTFPAVKEGSIIELAYTINSDYIFNLQPWAFQSEYPHLWSEYQVELPDFFNYVFLSQGYLPFHINKKESSYKNFRVIQQSEHIGLAADVYSFSGSVYKTRWVIKDAPALKEERFTSTLKNHISKIDFQLSQIRFPESPVKNIMGNWVSASEALLKDEDFGVPLQRDNNWLNDDMRGIVTKTASTMEKARTIYAYVRDNFTCTSHSDVKINTPLKSTFSKKSGTVADLNLLLIAMLRHEDITAYPILLSTKQHGFALEMYPLMDRFNYVIAEVLIGDDTYYLDASRQLGFGKLASDCYNGCGRVISENPLPVFLYADSLKEEKITSIFMSNGEKGELLGKFTSQLGASESSNLREGIRKTGKEEYAKKINSSFNGDATIDNLALDSLKSLENTVTVHYDFTMDAMKQDLVYFNPVILEGYHENPFKAAERLYPVEMPYTMNEIYLLSMEVPAGYVVDELPKSAKVNFNGDEGYFEYIISKSGNFVQLRTKVILRKANFSPEDYGSLRDFFGYVVKKHSEQIVFKKIK